MKGESKLKDTILRTLTSYSIINILASPIYAVVLFWLYLLGLNLGEVKKYEAFYLTGAIMALYVFFAIFPVVLNLIWTAYKAQQEKKVHYSIWLIIVLLISALTSYGWISVISVVSIFIANKWMHKIGYRVQALIISLPFAGLIAFTFYMIHAY